MSTKQILIGVFFAANSIFIMNWFTNGIPLGFSLRSIDHFGNNKTCLNNDTFVKFVRVRCEDNLCFSSMPRYCKDQKGHFDGETPTPSLLDCTIVQTKSHNSSSMNFLNTTACFGEIRPEELNLSYAGFWNEIFFIVLFFLIIGWIVFGIDVHFSANSHAPVPNATNLSLPIVLFNYNTQQFTIKEDSSTATSSMTFDASDLFGSPYRVVNTLYVPLKSTSGIMQLKSMKFQNKQKAAHALSLLHSFFQ